MLEYINRSFREETREEQRRISAEIMVEIFLEVKTNYVQIESTLGIMQDK